VATPLGCPLKTRSLSFMKRRHPGGGRNLNEIQTPSTVPIPMPDTLRLPSIILRVCNHSLSQHKANP